MRPLAKTVTLFAVLIFYTFLFWATKKEICDEDCLKHRELNQLLIKDRNYFYGVSRCSPGYSTDTLCIYAKQTAGVNWSLFADTVCMYANSVGLSRQMILIFNFGVYPADTLAKKLCP